MAKPRVFKSGQPTTGPIPRNTRAGANREQSRGLAITRVEPSHQHNHDRKMQSMKRVKRAK